MSSVSLALKNAGVKVPPLKKRIWLWLKDHPAKSYREISIALNELHTSVSSTLTEMSSRGMLSYSKAESEGKKGHNITRYSIVSKEYELLPMPIKNSPCKTHTTKVEVDAPIIRIEPKPVSKIDIEQLTVSEARALYRKLQEFFK